VSLHGTEFEEVLAGLLKVDPKSFDMQYAPEQDSQSS
jgi:hypothetical protein